MTKKTAAHQDAILAALRAKSPQRPGDLAKTLKLRRPLVTKQLTALIARGAVVATGKTNNRQVSVPGRAKEAP